MFLKMDKAIRALVKNGSWSMYELHDGKLALFAPGKNGCCRSHLKHNDKYYALSEDGSIGGKLDSKGIKIARIIHLPE